jgi:hypothetical protein
MQLTIGPGFSKPRRAALEPADASRRLSSASQTYPSASEAENRPGGSFQIDCHGLWPANPVRAVGLRAEAGRTLSS